MSVGTHPDLDAQPIDQLAVNTIRVLAMDAVQAANSGHPGTPMALAPVGYTLWTRFLRFDPELPVWANRDRFVLSAGHASTLLYALLHLSGVKSVNPDYETVGTPAVTLDDLRRFRQLDSKCPGHPEYRWTSGVECTTGPLGTGIATSVGMAIAGLWQAATFNRPGLRPVRLRRLRVAGDGCLMEGIGAEAASLAGHLKLSNLCWFYDNNQITIEGATSLAFSEDVPARFAGYGWAVQHVTDANDLDALSAAIEAFKAETDRPTLIVVDSVIGYGAPHKQGTHAAHGEPLGVDEVAATKRFYHWPEDADVPRPRPGPRARRRQRWPRTAGGCRREWEELFARYAPEYPRAGRAAQPDAAPDPARRVGRRPPGVPARPEGRREPRLGRQGAQRGRRTGAVADRRLVGPGPVEQVTPDLRGRGRLQRRATGPGATCTSGSASTPPPRSATGWRCPSCAPTRPGSSSSPTSSAARCGSPR